MGVYLGVNAGTAADGVGVHAGGQTRSARRREAAHQRAVHVQHHRHLPLPAGLE